MRGVSQPGHRYPVVWAMDEFVTRLLAMPAGYREGHYEGRRYSATVEISADGRRRKLYAEELGGRDHISFNFYQLNDGAPLLKPCEMPEQKVIDFVLGFAPETAA